METTNNPPKTFISYSWTNPEHEHWVLQLATQLVENGVDVILDKWKLREGADKYVFMEKMVTDSSVTKVIMVCDKAYAEKADSRKGGVGTETQVISGEIYSKVEDNKKFVAVIKEKDEKGQAYLPKYLNSRMYIDMSDLELESQNFEQLLRWIFDRPVYQKPELGNPPTYIFEDNPISLGTSSKLRFAIEALKQNKNNASGLIRDYFETLADNFEELRIIPKAETNFDDLVIESIDSFLPYRDEFLDLISAIVRYSQDNDYVIEIGNFFERILPFLFYKLNNNWDAQRTHYDFENDNYIFIIRELFLSSIAVFIKNQRFNWANDLLNKEFFSDARLSDYTDNKLYSFMVLNQFAKSLGSRTERLQMSVNVNTELVHQRANRKDLNINDIMQADLVLYLRYELLKLRGGRWFPYSLLKFPYSPFEMFVRSESVEFFDRFKLVLGIENKDQLAQFLDEYNTDQFKRIAINHFQVLDVRSLTNFDRLSIK